jgi:hypothetical protein
MKFFDDNDHVADLSSGNLTSSGTNGLDKPLEIRKIVPGVNGTFPENS